MSDVLELRPSVETYIRHVRGNYAIFGGFATFSLFRVLVDPGPGAWALLAAVVVIAALRVSYFRLSRLRLTDTELSWRWYTGRTYRCDAGRIERVVVVKEFSTLLALLPWRRTFVKAAGQRRALHLHAFTWAVEDQDRLVALLADQGCNVHRYGSINTGASTIASPGYCCGGNVTSWPLSCSA